MKSAACRTFHCVISFFTALGSLYLGLVALKYDVLKVGYIEPYALYIKYFFGLCGLLGLALLFVHGMFCECDKK